MELRFSDEAIAKIEELKQRYETAAAVLLPALYLAQEEFGSLSVEVMDLVARTLNLPHSRVFSTATFYSLFHKKPVGRHIIQVCTSLSCFLRGSDAILQAVEKKLRVLPGQTTEDGLFTLQTVECLACCGTAPAVRIDQTYYEAMTPDKIVRVIDSLREEEK